MASGQTGFGRYLMMAGVALLAFMLFGWFRHIIRESMTGLYKRPDGQILQAGHGLVHLLRSDVLSGFFGCCSMHASLRCPGWMVRATG